MKLYKFMSPTCMPCKKLGECLDELKVDYQEVNIINDDDDTLELVMKYHIKGVPTLIKIDDEGNEINRFVGFVNMETLKEFLK